MCWEWFSYSVQNPNLVPFLLSRASAFQTKGDFSAGTRRTEPDDKGTSREHLSRKVSGCKGLSPWAAVLSEVPRCLGVTCTN